MNSYWIVIKMDVLEHSFYFKLYLFYNNNTRLQIGHNLVGWRINTKHFQSGKTIGISSLDEKPQPTHAGCGIQAHNLPVTQW